MAYVFETYGLNTDKDLKVLAGVLIFCNRTGLQKPDKFADWPEAEYE